MEYIRGLGGWCTLLVVMVVEVGSGGGVVVVSVLTTIDSICLPMHGCMYV